MQHTLTFRRFPARVMKNLRLSLHYYEHERPIFHLQPVPSKNVERRRQNSALKKKLVKNVFFAIGDSPKSGKNGKIIFSIFEAKCPKSILRPKWDILGVKWRYGTFNKLENTKIEIRLVPPLRKNYYSIENLRFL